MITVPLLLVLLGACSAGSSHTGRGAVGDDDVAPDAGHAGRIDELIGTWTIAAGTSQLACSDGTDMQPVVGTFAIEEGSIGDVQRAMSQCPPVQYDVIGSVATYVPAQSCVLHDVPRTVAFVAGGLTLSPNGKTLSIDQTMTVTFSGTSAPSPCTIHEVVTAHR